MERTLLVAALCCFLCCSVLIGQVSAQAQNVDVSFYNIMTNSSTKQCNITGRDGPSTLQASVSMGKYSSAVITVPVQFHHLGLTQVRANVSGSNQQLSAVVNVSAIGQTNSINWKTGTASVSMTYAGKKFSNLMLGTTNTSQVTNSTKACLNVAVAYMTGNSTRNLTAFSIGCWSLVNNSLSVQPNIQPKLIQSWLNDFNKKVCSGALSSLQPASLFTLLAASLGALLLATRS